MRKVMLGFVSMILSLGCVSAEEDVVGVWKLVSYEIEFQDNGERREPFGRSPIGYIIFTPQGRMMAYLEAQNRTPPTNDEGRATAFRTIIAYTGKYRLQNDQWITLVDGSWNVDWTGTEQARRFKLENGKLYVVSQWNPSRIYNGRTVRGNVSWEREK